MKSQLQKVSLTALCLAGMLLFSCQQKQQAKHHFLDLSARDTTVRPQDNFFEYANGTWLKNAKIPADKVVKDAFNVMEVLNNHIKSILDSCTHLKNPESGSPAQQIGDFYQAAMDSVAVDKAGLQPLQASLDRIAAINSPGDIIDEMVQEYKDGDWLWAWYSFGGNGPLLSMVVYTDDKNSDKYRFQCMQGGLGLPNKNYYFKKDSTSQNIIKTYKTYIATLLNLSGDSATSDRDAEQVYALEKKLAAASKTPVQLRDPEANYHLMSVATINKRTPQIRWDEVIKKLGIQTDSLIVKQPKYYTTLSELLSNIPVKTWKDYLSFHLINHYTAWLSQPFDDASFDFYGKTLYGLKKEKPRWKRVVALTNMTLGDALGQLYVKKYFPPSSKKYMMGLVDNLKSAYREQIQNLTWMSDTTKEKALDKLNAIVKKIGYPDKWKDYASVQIAPDALIADLKRMGQWYLKYDLDKLHQPVDRSEWFMTPTTVNAYYNPTANDINFPAGILVPPFYFKNGDDALNYGGIGMVIGHEMTHGFDDEGSQYDKKGNLKIWWTKTDRKNFEKRAKNIIQQYNHYAIQDSIHLNGKRTEGENIADNGGLKIAYFAFKKTKEGQSDSLINGLTPDQRFFLSLAQIWRMKVRPKSLLLQVNTDFHSPAQFRVNGSVSNFDAFYKAFDVKPGDKMYRPDSLRVSLW